MADNTDYNDIYLTLIAFWVYYICGRVKIMNLKQLQYFITIADEGNISAAARKLYMSQPPLSYHIKLLEDELKCELFYRYSRNLVLTPAGETLYRYAKDIIELSDVAMTETMNIGHKTEGTLRIGMVSSVVGSVAMEWIREFSKKYPEVHFEIIEGDTYELLNRFKSGMLHIGIIRTPFVNDGLKIEKIFTDKLVMIGDRNLLPDNDETVNCKYLESKKLIIYKRWKSIIEAKFEKEEAKPDFYIINDDARTTAYFVESGLGIGIIPESATSVIKGNNIVVRHLEEPDITSDVVLAYSDEETLPLCAQRFIDYVRECTYTNSFSVKS